MSDTKHQRGLLVPMIFPKSQSLEETCQAVAERGHGVYELPDNTSSFKEYLTQDLTDQYIVLDGVLYAIQDVVNIDLDESIYRCREKVDGSYDFEIKYYNGGCSMEEALEDAYKNLE